MSSARPTADPAERTSRAPGCAADLRPGVDRPASGAEPRGRCVPVRRAARPTLTRWLVCGWMLACAAPSLAGTAPGGPASDAAGLAGPATLAAQVTPVEDPSDPKTMASLGEPLQPPAWPVILGALAALGVGLVGGAAWQRRAEGRDERSRRS